MDRMHSLQRNRTRTRRLTMRKDIFKTKEGDILERGLQAMTRSCDTLKEQNDLLHEQVESMKVELARLKDRLLIDREERE